ncbi:MAG: serine--tRNA ligase [Armatimonadetes bacterium]|nr:serine--tRNA ligase [Armatimonadota bacterium]
MLDPKLIRNQPDGVRAALERRKMDPSIVDRLLEIDRRRRDLVQEGDELKQLRNRVSKELGEKKRAGEDISEQSARMKEVGTRIKDLDVETAALEEEQTSILEVLPNPPHAEVPRGGGSEDNVEVRRWGEPRSFDFEARAHWDIGEALDILDFKRASKISGARFWVLKGAGARLERALISFMLDLHTQQHGYREIMPPALVTARTVYGTGQLPKFKEDLFRCEGTELYLIPTSEVPITGLHAQEILEADQLPVYYCGFTPCFRSEAGAAGKDTRGLVRVHQFHKVELIKLTAPDRSFQELEGMVNNAERVLQLLEIPHRVMKLCDGDLGFASATTYDLEFWSPPQQRWIEISSCSNCTDFQARRSGIRFRPQPGAPTEFVHTLNGSGLAVGRTMVAILENYQQPDGSVSIPAVLRPYMGGTESIGAGD